MPWGLLRTPPLDGAVNMAIDDVLMEEAARTSTTIVRLYEWSRPTLSLGRNQRAKDVYDLGRLEAESIHVVRRPTGGRAVLHWREVTYSVAAPVSASLRETYDEINQLLVAALRDLGVAAEVARPAKRAPSPTVAPCFEEPTGGEVVVEGRKLVGSAQYRTEHALLQHGSLLLDDDQSRIASLMVGGGPPLPPPATLRSLLDPALEADHVVTAIGEAVRSAHQPYDFVMSDVLRARAAEVANHYRDESWTWRR